MKHRVDFCASQVYAEATLAFPLIVAATFAKVENGKDHSDATPEP
jgi:deoxyhypusine synthase